MFCLLVVLVKLSVLTKWLARKTPLRKRNRVKGIISRNPRPKSVHDFLGLLYCFIVLWCMCCLLPLCDILSYCYGVIKPICAESAVKPQANKTKLVLFVWWQEGQWTVKESCTYGLRSLTWVILSKIGQSVNQGWKMERVFCRVDYYAPPLGVDSIKWWCASDVCRIHWA